MKIEDPRSVNSAPVSRPANPANQGAGRTEAGLPQTGASAASQPATRVELSSRSREMHEAMAAAESAPDVRADKVADAQQRISQGTYTVNAESVARGILDTRA